MKLERYTKKPWGTYPRCGYVDDHGKQCTATTYSNDLCYGHFQNQCAGMCDSQGPIRSQFSAVSEPNQ